MTGSGDRHLPAQRSPLAEMAKDVNDLTLPRTVRHMFAPVEARLQGRTVHVVRVPSLLAQLRIGLRPGQDSEAAMSGAYGSRPAVRSDALDALLEIERGVVQWADRFEVRMRSTLEASLRLLVGAATGTDAATVRAAAGDVEHWHSHARTVTGWDQPPWRPNVECPACDRRGGLRVRLETRTAVCVECRETWTPGTIGLLAEHVRLVTDGAGDARGIVRGA